MTYVSDHEVYVPLSDYEVVVAERDEARAALAVVERALTLACDDAWSDALAAKQYYLDLAADRTPSEER